MIEIKNLSKSFQTPRGTKNVLSDFSLSIKDGIFLGISGESGSGKSTLLSIITGLQKANTGHVFIDGTDILSLEDKELCAFRNKNIGFISQEQSFLKNLTVLENLILPAFLLKERKVKKEELLQKAKNLLEGFGIESLSDSNPSCLSGGELQRLLIARSLINDPKILVADEPTDNVSKKQTKEIISIFKQISLSGKTVILVSHDENALELCDEVFYLE